MTAQPETVHAVDVTWECSSTLGKFATALAAAQAEMGHAAKDSKNPHFNSRYADLASVREASAPVATHGIAITQMVITRPDGTPGLRTMLIHSSGEWMASNAWCKADKPGPQALGSVLTYLRRYMLAAALCIAQDDDDANAASDGPGPRQPPRRDPPATGEGRTFNGKETKSCGGPGKEKAGASGAISDKPTAIEIKELREALEKVLPGDGRDLSVQKERARYIAWACGAWVDRLADLTRPQWKATLDKATAGEVQPAAETAA